MTKHWKHPVICSHITAKLVLLKIRCDAKYLTALPLNQPEVIENVEVTLLDANHCPGSVMFLFKVKGCLDLIPSPSPSVKIQIMGGKVCLRCKGKTLLGGVDKLLRTKTLLTLTNNVLSYYLKLTFPPIIWIFTEGDGIEPRLSS